MSGYLSSIREHRLAGKVSSCAGTLRFREWLAHGGKMTLHRGYFCQIPLLCPVCAIRRSGKMLRRYVERAAYLAETHNLTFVTLTVLNGSDLAERESHLRHSFKAMRGRAKKGYGFFAGILGGIVATEFTRGEDGSWHPHLHMVVATPKGSGPIEWGRGSALARDWEKATGDSYIVHAKPIQAGSQDKLVSAFCEVLKYSLKFSGLELADNFHAYRTLKGKRLLSSFGCFWGLELPEDATLEDDPLDGPFIEHVYRWSKQAGYALLDVIPGEVTPA